MPCARRTAVFFIAFFLWTYPSTSVAWEPVDIAKPGDSLNGPDFGVGAIIASIEWSSLPDGTPFIAWIRDGVVMAGSDKALTEDAMHGAVLLTRDAAGDPTILMIDSFRRLPSGLTVYTLSRQIDSYADAMTWEPVCTDKAGKSAEGMFLPGHWDEKTGNYFADGFTFACSGGALAKCTEAGYSAWDPDLLDYALACVRMIRADYCGDGISHTREGTLISFGDSLGIHYLSPESDWVFEATWTKKGASCLGSAPIKGDSTMSAPIKRWVNLWGKPDSKICLIPSCSSEDYVPTSVASLSSACQPNANQPTKCAPWYFVPSP